mmetsp:Transcript_2791/g.6804  ORF Transcript_2791/g.6804 Transcript_2791/m.6804 type:complete len:482 (-) Transcript_2791:31-1476(-)
MVSLVATPRSISSARRTPWSQRHPVWYVALVSGLIGAIVSSTLWAEEVPGALSLSFRQSFHLGRDEIGRLLSAFALPNTIAPFWGGYCIDRFGLKFSGLVLVSTIFFGSLLFAQAPHVADDPMPCFVAARVIIGLGGDSLITWGQTASNLWFAGEHESLSMGTVLGVGIIGSASSLWFLEDIAHATSLDFALWCSVGWTFCCIGLLFVYCLVSDKYLATVPLEEEDEATTEPSIRDTLQLLPGLFWMENLVAFFVLPCLYVAASFTPYFLAEEYAMSKREATRCASLIFWVLVVSPVAGMVCDRFGYRLWVQIGSILAAIIGYILLYLRLANPYLTITWIGLAFAFIEQNIYTIVGRLIEPLVKEVHGRAFGLNAMFIQSGIMTMPLVVGSLASGAAHPVQNLVFVASLGVGLALACAMLVLDRGVGRSSVNLTATNLALRQSYSTLPQFDSVVTTARSSPGTDPDSAVSLVSPRLQYLSC